MCDRQVSAGLGRLGASPAGDPGAKGQAHTRKACARLGDSEAGCFRREGAPCPGGYASSHLPECREEPGCWGGLSPSVLPRRCKTCGEYIYKGKKFNARKETVQNEAYLGLPIFRFYIKCTRCLAEITFKVDTSPASGSFPRGLPPPVLSLHGAPVSPRPQETGLFPAALCTKARVCNDMGFREQTAPWHMAGHGHDRVENLGERPGTLRSAGISFYLTLFLLGIKKGC